MNTKLFGFDCNPPPSPPPAPPPFPPSLAPKPPPSEPPEAQRIAAEATRIASHTDDGKTKEKAAKLASEVDEAFTGTDAAKEQSVNAFHEARLRAAGKCGI